MNKNYVCHRGGPPLIAVVLALAFSSCSLKPVQRVHSAASVPRTIDVNTASFREDEPRQSAFEMNGGVGYGLAWTDVGNSAGSEIYYVGINYRSARFAIGWTPYLGAAQVSHEGTHVFGSTLWYAFHFGGGGRWRFSFQNSYTAANEVAEDTGCTSGLSGLFGTGCSSGQQSSARSQVKVQEVGFVLSAERHLSPEDALLLAPALYWTNIATGNELDVDPSGNYVLRTVFWSPGLQVGVRHRFGPDSRNALSLLAGAQWIKTFRPDWAVRQLVPTVDAKFQF